MPKKYFEDLTDGKPLDCDPVVLSRDDIINFARQYDPQTFHIDEEAARASIFGGLIASALHILSACTRVIVDAQDDVAILSGLGLEEVRMFNPVRPEDVLRVEAWWTEFRRSQSKPDRGFATIRCKIRNQKDEPVVEYGYRYMLACRVSR